MRAGIWSIMFTVELPELKTVPGKCKGSIFSYLKRMTEVIEREGLMEAGRDGD